MFAESFNGLTTVICRILCDLDKEGFSPFSEVENETKCFTYLLQMRSIIKRISRCARSSPRKTILVRVKFECFGKFGRRR